MPETTDTVVAKPIWYSKTFWTNAVVLLASIAAMFGLDFDAEVQASVVALIMAIINIVLRYVTEKPVVMSSEAKTVNVKTNV